MHSWEALGSRWPELQGVLGRMEEQREDEQDGVGGEEGLVCAGKSQDESCSRQRAGAAGLLGTDTHLSFPPTPIPHGFL